MIHENWGHRFYNYYGEGSHFEVDIEYLVYDEVNIRNDYEPGCLFPDLDCGYYEISSDTYPLENYTDFYTDLYDFYGYVPTGTCPITIWNCDSGN